MRTNKLILALLVALQSQHLMAGEVCYEGIVGTEEFQNVMTICLENEHDARISMYYPNRPEEEPANCSETARYSGDAYTGNMTIQGEEGPCDNGRVMYGWDFVCTSTGNSSMSCETSVSEDTYHFKMLTKGI